MNSRRTLAVALPVILVACRTPGDVTPAPATSCLIGQELERTGDTVDIAVSNRFDEPLPAVPLHDDHRLVHRQLYESLVSMDCAGNLVPGLASAWESHQSGTEWRFTIRPGATYWDGVRVSIVDVIESWERNWDAIEPLVPPGEYFNVVDAVSYDRLVIRLEEPDSTLPVQLSRLELAVQRPAASNDEWPIGTAPYRPIPSRQGNGALLLEPIQTARPWLRFLPVGGADVRDALDAGLDVVIGRDKDVIDYVRRREDYVDIPLRWDLTFALVTKNNAIDMRGVDHDELMALRNAVAGDAVQIDARPSNCRRLGTSEGGMVEESVGSDLLTYDMSDTTARAIAERLVAVTGARSSSSSHVVPPFRRIVPTNRADPVEQILSGDGGGAIVRYPVRDACDPPPLASADLGLTVLPLIEARTHLFSLAGRVHIALGWDGIPMFFPDASRISR